MMIQRKLNFNIAWGINLSFFRLLPLNLLAIFLHLVLSLSGIQFLFSLTPFFRPFLDVFFCRLNNWTSSVSFSLLKSARTLTERERERELHVPINPPKKYQIQYPTQGYLSIYCVCFGVDLVSLFGNFGLNPLWMLCILFIPSVIFNVVYKPVQAAGIKVLAAPVFGNFKGRKEKL